MIHERVQGFQRVDDFVSGSPRPIGWDSVEGFSIAVRTEENSIMCQCLSGDAGCGLLR